MLGCGLCGGTLEVAAAAVIGGGGFGLMTTYAIASLVHRFAKNKVDTSSQDNKDEKK